MTVSRSQPDTTGYTEAEGYAASLRQQAELMNDPEELLFAAAFIERQAARCDAVTEIVRELREDYPAVDVTTVVFSPDFSNVGCCVIPQDRVLAIIAALSTLPSADRS